MEKLEVVSSNVEKQERRIDLAKRLDAKLNSLKEEVMVKKYPIEGNRSVAIGIKDFIKNKAKWKFTEAYGVVETCRVLDEEIQKMKKEDSGFHLSAVTIEAIYYFMTKEENVGLAMAASFVNGLLSPITAALNISKSDRDTINQMERDLGSLQDAIHNKVAVEKEDSFISRLEEELEKELES